MQNLIAFLLTLLTVFSASAGLNLTKVQTPSIGYYAPLVINETLVYRDEASQIWLNSGSSEGSVLAQVNGKPVKAIHIIKNENTLLFINNSDNNSLWETDGLTFNKLSDLAFIGLSTKGNLPIALTSNSNVFITINGSNLKQYDLGIYTISDENNNVIYDSFVCSIDENSAIIKARSADLQGSGFFLHTNNELTLLTNVEVGGQPLPNSSFELQHSEHCYISYQDANNYKKFTRINSKGEFELLANITSDGQNGLEEIFEFDQQLYGLGRLNNQTSPAIFGINQSSVTPKFVSQIQADFIRITDISVTPEYVYIYSHVSCFPFAKCTPPPPGDTQVLVLDTSFNQVNQIIIPQAYNYRLNKADDKEFLIVDSAIQSLYGLENGINSSPLSLPSVTMNSILGGANQNYYLGTINKITRQQEVYKVSQQTVVSQQLNGLWINDAWQNQGLVLSTGIRDDDSEYLFASFYIYKDGNPFWVAGSAELNTGSPSISFELFEFTGPSIIENETGVETQQLSFGQLTLTPESCNNLNLSLETNDSEVLELDLTRIVNKTYDSLCVE